MEELVGMDLRALLHGEDGRALYHQLGDLEAQAERSLTRRCRMRTKENSWRWFEATLRKNPSEVGDGLLLHATDINDLQRMEVERQVTADIVHALNETANLDQLLARIHSALRQVLPAENCFVALHNPAEDMFEFPFFVDEFDVAPPPQKMGRT